VETSGYGLIVVFYGLNGLADRCRDFVVVMYLGNMGEPDSGRVAADLNPARRTQTPSPGPFPVNGEGESGADSGGEPLR